MTTPAAQPEHGFRIHTYRPSRLTPPQFYEAIVGLLGLKHVAPQPHEVEQLQVESDGHKVHLELLMADGQLGVADYELDRGIRGLL